MGAGGGAITGGSVTVVSKGITSCSGSRSGTDFAYGLGIQTNFTKTVYGQVDYMQSYDKDGVSAKGYTLSLGTRF